MRLVILLLGMFLAQSALARSGQRDGVNFGTRARVLDETDTQSVSDGTDSHNVQSVAVSPFVGYVVSTYFDLGLSLTSEHTTITDTHTGTDSQVYSTISDEQLRGGSLFARLLFAKYMYLEAGAGVYSVSSKVTQSTVAGGASFAGSSSSTSHNGTGFGYHGGGGIEIPVGLGWFLTTSIYVRNIEMTEMLTQSSSNKLSNMKSELEFGVTQYVQ